MDDQESERDPEDDDKIAAHIERISQIFLDAMRPTLGDPLTPDTEARLRQQLEEAYKSLVKPAVIEVVPSYSTDPNKICMRIHIHPPTLRDEDTQQE